MLHKYCCALNGSQLWPLWHDSVNKMCIQWRNALRKIWKLPYGSHRDLIPLIAECIPLDVVLAFRYVKFYRKLDLPDNMVVTFIGNTMTFTYRFSMG